MHANTSRLKKFFLGQVKPGINSCLKLNSGLSAIILTCCAIDFLAKFYSGSSNNRENKSKYIDFLSKYFPIYSPHEEFYKFVRCGLVHSYDMEGKYIIIHSNAKWAQQLNMKFSPKHKAYILNPFVLRKDLYKAFDEYISNLNNNKGLRKNLDKVYGEKPIRKQYLKTPKFKYLAKKGLLK